MKAFITGATGFIGGHLARTLVKKGHEVHCLVRPLADTRYLEDTAVQLLVGDLLEPETFREQLLECDTVFHVAGTTKAVSAKGYYNGNVQATINLLEIMELSGADSKKLLFVSSQAAASPSLSSHFSETESDTLPVSEYGRSKLAAEEAIIEGKSDGNFTILRPSIVFGPNDYEMLPLFKAARSGIIPHPGFDDFPVNYIYVDDLIEAILLATTNDTAIGKTYFVHDGKPSSWKVMNTLIKNEVNRRAIIVPIARRVLQLVCILSGLLSKVTGKAAYMNLDKWHEIKQDGWLCSSQRINEDLGFSAQWQLEKSVATTASWYRANGLL